MKSGQSFVLDTSNLCTYPVSLVAESNIPTQELFYLRYMYSKFTHTRFARDREGILLAYLWDTYGLTFSNSATQLLRYSVMASAAIDIRGRSHIVPTEYYEYLSRLHEDTSIAIRKGSIDETHLFAVYFAIYNATSHSSVTTNHSAWPSEAYTYANLFLAIMEHLLQEARTTRRQFPLQYIWRFMLSSLRRIYPDAPVCFLVRSTHCRDRLNYSIHLLDSKLTNQWSGHKIAQQIAGGSSQGRFHIGRFWDVLDVLYSFKACFRASYTKQSWGSRPLRE